MKKIKAFLFAVSLFVAVLANAQTEYHWDEYGVGFAVTEDFMVTTNSVEEFAAVSSDGLMDITILPWADALVTEADLEGHLISFAAEMAYEVDDMAADDLVIDDFVGKFLVAQQDTELMLVAFMLDKLSNTNIIVIITFAEGNEDEAIEILGSFYAYD